MANEKLHLRFMHFLLVTLPLFLFLIGCGVNETSKAHITSFNQNQKNGDYPLGFSGLKNGGGEQDLDKELVLEKSDSLTINLSDMYSIKSEDYIVTDVQFRDLKSKEKNQYGDLSEIDSLEYVFEFFESTNSDQEIIFNVKSLIEDKSKILKLGIVLGKKNKEIEIAESKRFVVEVLVTPITEEIINIVEKEKESLDIKCKEELKNAFQSENITVGDLQIADDLIPTSLFSSETSKINLKVVFTESVDILEPKLTCDKNNLLIYYFPINYVLNKESGSISEVFLSEYRKENIHEKCREADKEFN